MDDVSLFPGGPAVGPVGYRLWRFAGRDPAEAGRLIGAALDAGVTLIDNADVYGFGTPDGFGAAERLLGELFTRDRGLRRRMVLVTKGGVCPPVPYDATGDALLRACDASLSRMGVPDVDLYLVHRPDPLTHPADTARALDEIRRSGRAAHVGVSNYTASQARALAAHLDAPLAVNQVEVSAWAQDAMTDGTLDWCMEAGTGVMAWSPLAGGRIATGTAPDGASAARFADVTRVLDEIATAHGRTRAAAALAFVRQHPAAPLPLIGTGELARIAAAVGDADLRLTRREWFSVMEARRGARLP